MRIFGIIGYPLTHSFSQKYFTAKFQREKTRDCVYESYPIRSIGELSGLIKDNPDLRGLNITLPYKQSVFELLDDRTHIPAGLTASNCILIKDGKLSGYNTDISGFEQSLVPHLKVHHAHALILGNGGAAEAVKFVLQKLNISYKIVSRKISGDTALNYGALNGDIMREHLLIINTTPLGTFPEINECLDLPYEFLTADHFLYDLVYNPGETLFMHKGASHGAFVKNGYEMLVLQAEESWRIWNEDQD